MTRMTRKRAEVLFKKRWADIGNEDWHKSVGPLCYSMPLPLRKYWYAYWSKINTHSHTVIHKYFEDCNACHKEIDFLRLLTVHLFIRHTYKD